jgi:steroid delta-isomerase-like uncharacterized protein
MKKLIMILPLALILCFMVGCQDKEAMAELEGFKAQAALEEQNKDLVKRYIEESNKTDIEIFKGLLKEFYSPNRAAYSPSNKLRPAMSEEERIEYHKTVLRAFPDFNLRIEEIFADGDRVIIRGLLTGTHEEEFQGLPATGNKIKVSFINILQIKDGKIIEDRTDMDTLGFMMQLGLELKPKEGE